MDDIKKAQEQLFQEMNRVADAREAEARGLRKSLTNLQDTLNSLGLEGEGETAAAIGRATEVLEALVKRVQTWELRVTRSREP